MALELPSDHLRISIEQPDQQPFQLPHRIIHASRQTQACLRLLRLNRY